MVRIAILASGSGSNAERILSYLKDNQKINVCLIVTNVADAGVLKHANNFNVPLEVITKKEFNDQDYTIDLLRKYNLDYIILAGFLLMVPPFLIYEYENRILNIHPSLLPKYGGKGMYGHHVHQAVKEANESISGMTIHLVNEEYDRGEILFQGKCRISLYDSVDDIASSVLSLEHTWYPKVIEKYILAKEGIE